MNSGSHMWEGLTELLAGCGIPLMLSLAATAVKTIRSTWRGWRHFISSLTTSIFTGQIVFWGLNVFPDMVSEVKAAAVAVAAYMSGSLLDTVINRVKKDISEGKSLLRRKGGPP